MAVIDSRSADVLLPLESMGGGNPISLIRQYVSLCTGLGMKFVREAYIAAPGVQPSPETDWCAVNIDRISVPAGRPGRPREARERVRRDDPASNPPLRRKLLRPGRDGDGLRFPGLLLSRPQPLLAQEEGALGNQHRRNLSEAPGHVREPMDRPLPARLQARAGGHKEVRDPGHCRIFWCGNLY